MGGTVERAYDMAVVLRPLRRTRDLAVLLAKSPRAWHLLTMLLTHDVLAVREQHTLLLLLPFGVVCLLIGHLASA